MKEHKFDCLSYLFLHLHIQLYHTNHGQISKFVQQEKKLVVESDKILILTQPIPPRYQSTTIHRIVASNFKDERGGKAHAESSSHR